MATELLDAGGCYNSMRYARDGAGQGSRDYIVAHNTPASMLESERLLLAVCIDAATGMGGDADDATFKLQWENFTDAPGTWIDLAATGEIKFATDTDLIDGNAVIVSEDSGGNVVDCSGSGHPHADGLEKENANGFTRTIVKDFFEEFHWAINLTDADFLNEDEYGFRLTQADDTVIGTMTDRLTVIKPGKIDGTTKNKNRTAAVNSVQVTAFLSDGAGPPKPVGSVVGQLVSSGSDGTFSITGLVSGQQYFLHFFKDDTEDLSDGSPEVTAIDDF